MRICPICKTKCTKTKIFLKENIKENKLSKFSFASRKEPEFMNYRLVRCLDCHLVFASNPPNLTELKKNYHSAGYDSSNEAYDAAISYIAAMSSLIKNLSPKNKVLEIGTGTGILLELLKELNFKDVFGIEPSINAIKAAPRSRQKWITHGFFEDQKFKHNSFDLICCFMTMEHVLDPMTVSKKAYSLLRPGGIFITVTHDYEYILNKILGKRSPIIDIEHMQLFSNKSIETLFLNSSFKKISSKNFKNNYQLDYWVKLLPISNKIKSKIIQFLRKLKLNRLKISLNVGNTITAGIK